MCKNTMIKITISVEIPNNSIKSLVEVDGKLYDSPLPDSEVKEEMATSDDVEIIQKQEKPEAEAKGFPEENVRQEFFDLAKNKFASEKDALAFCDTILSAKKTLWTTEDYRMLIKEASELADYVAGEKPEENGEETGEDSEELEAYRIQFTRLCVVKFATVEKRNIWILENVSPRIQDEWTVEMYRNGLELMAALPNKEPSKDVLERLDNEKEKAHDTVIQQAVQDLLAAPSMNLFVNFIDLGKKKFPTKAARDKWIAESMGKTTDTDLWSREDYALGIVLLRYLPYVQDAPGNGQDAATDNLAPILTGVTYDAIRRLVTASPKYPMMRSKEFRSRTEGIMGHKYGAFKKIREEEGKRVLKELEKEAQAELTGEIVDDDPLNQGEHVAPGDPKANANKDLIPEDVLTDEQYEKFVYLVGQMPSKFRTGSLAIRDFVTAAIRKTDKSFRYSDLGSAGIRKLTVAQGDVVIAAQNDFVGAVD